MENSGFHGSIGILWLKVAFVLDTTGFRVSFDEGDRLTRGVVRPISILGRVIVLVCVIHIHGRVKGLAGCRVNGHTISI